MSLMVRMVSATHLPHEDIDFQGVVVVDETFAEAALTDQPQKHHLDQAILGMCVTETACETQIVVGPELDDTVTGAGDPDTRSADLDFPPLAGDSHPTSPVRNIIHESSFSRAQRRQYGFTAERRYGEVWLNLGAHAAGSICRTAVGGRVGETVRPMGLLCSKSHQTSEIAGTLCILE
jgi:hypothetical protein